LEPFSYDPAHPYASGQHRGIDIGADSPGEAVVAPAAGTVSFAGTVASNGKSVTIQTPDGYSVTLTHLGSILVAKGQAVAERDAVGTIGPSGTPEVEGPYLHLGIRVTSDPNGYLDPLGFLPQAATDSGSDGSTSSQPGAGTGTSATSGSVPSSSTGSTSTTSSQTAGSTTSSAHASSSDTKEHGSRPEHERSQERSDARPDRSSRRPAVQGVKDAGRASRPAVPRPRAVARASVSRRPVVETAAPAEPTGLGAGHELHRTLPVPQAAAPRRRVPSLLVSLSLNAAAALVALAAALTTARRRRRRTDASPVGAAQVLHLPQPSAEPRPASRAA
jgi:hypothetical protein